MRHVSLIEWYRLHKGDYSRVARNLGIDPSYVSKVANGLRRSEAVNKAIEAELRKLYRLRPEL